MVDVESLLQPITADAPGGPNLGYSKEFAELERTALGKPERQLGQSIVAAEPADWEAVERQAIALLGKSKDMRVAIYLARALLQTSSFAGLSDGLSLVRRLVESHWDIFHPRLDDDDNDPTARLNTMAALVDRELIQAVRGAAIVKSRSFGIVTLREIETANDKKGDQASGGASTIDAAFQEIAISELAGTANAIEQCVQEVASIVRSWVTHLEANPVDLGPLSGLLGRASQIVRSRLAQRQPVIEGGTMAASGDSTGSAASAPRQLGELRSREDVVRAIDVICDYYVRSEPSSPVPLLLERCRRLVSMSFLDIVKDMLPDGLSTIQTIAGKQSE